MELLDRYLQAVKRHLPWERQDDIIAELRANLEAQLEDKEAELGRALTKEEAEQWIKQLGAPLQVAGRYQRQQYLIGPRVFPTYAYILRLVLTWATVIYVVANAVTIAVSNQGGEAILRAALRLPWIWFVNAAIVTLIFVAIEWTGARFPVKLSGLERMAGPMTAQWSPLDLPPVAAEEPEWAKPRSFARALLQVFSQGVLLAYVLLVPHYPFLLFGPGAWYLESLPYQLAPVWWTFYWCLVGLSIFELTWHLADLARGTWQRPKSRALHIAMNSLSLIPLAVLLMAPNHALFQLKDLADEAKLGGTLAAANSGVVKGLAVVAAIVAIKLLWRIVQTVLEARRKRVAA